MGAGTVSCGGDVGTLVYIGAVSQNFAPVTYAIHVDIWHGLDNIPQSLDASVVTIGVFDGVHRGHRRLIGTAVRRARELDVPCVLMTFEPHPVKVFAPERAPRLLGSLKDRQAMAEELGVDLSLIHI